MEEQRDLIPSFWMGGAAWSDGVEAASKVLNTRYGMLSSIPMICKGKKCPFRESCYIPEEKLEPKARCPIEVATILQRFEQYVRHLEVDEENIVDMSLVRELVDIDIQLTRAEAKLAVDADFVEMVIATVDQQGNPWYKSELSKAVDYKDRLRKERHRILDLLDSTRKNKHENNKATDPSTMAAMLLARARELEKTGVNLAQVQTEESEA